MNISELVRYASIPMRLNVKPGDRVLLLTDTRTSPRIADALAIAVRQFDGIPVVMVVPAIDIPGQEPSQPAAEAILGCDIVVGCCSEMITHTAAVQNGIRHGVRYIAMGSVSEDDLTSGAAIADYDHIDRLTTRLSSILAAASSIRIQTPAGTDLSMDLKPGKTFCFSGVCRAPQLSACFPDGEVAAPPIEGTTNGRLVVDRSFHQIGHLRTPIVLDIVDGRVRSVSGGAEAEALKDIWRTRGDDNSGHVAHISIGTNDKARVTGHTQEHKKIYAGMHIGFGDDLFLGGSHASKTHLDGIIAKPTLTADGRVLLSDGQFSSLVTDGS